MKTRSQNLPTPLAGDRPGSELLLYCVRTNLNERLRQRVERLLQEGPDWTRLIEAALRHNVTPLLYWNLSRFFSHAIPTELLDALNLNTEDNRKRSHRLLGELLTLLNQSTSTGIRTLPVESPLLGEAAYGNHALRRAGREHILVHNEDKNAVHALLTDHGYCHDGVPEQGPVTSLSAYGGNPSYAIYHRGSDQLVAHLVLTHPSLPIPVREKDLWRRATLVSLQGKKILNLTTEDLLVVLCLIGAICGWTRLDRITEVAGLLNNHKNMDWGRCLSRARIQGHARILLLGVALANEVLGAELPELLEKQLQVEDNIKSRARLLKEQLFQSNITPQGFQFYAWHLWLRERPQDKFRFAIRAVSTTEGSKATRLTGWTDEEYLPDQPVQQKPVSEGAPTSNALNQAWSDRSEAWDLWCDTTAETDLDIKLLEATAVIPGMYVLDLASGTGNPAISLAQRAGPDGRVLATDLVPRMLLSLRQRVRESGLRNLCFCTADMQQLPFIAEYFDRVVCRFGIMFCPDLERGLTEIQCVLKPGGVAVFFVWGPLGENTVFDVLQKTVNGFAWAEKFLRRFPCPSALAGQAPCLLPCIAPDSSWSMNRRSVSRP